LGQRSRKRGRVPAGGGPAKPPPPEPAPEPKPPSRSEAKNEAARRKLEPLAPGERPLAVTVGAILCGLIAVGNVIPLALGTKVEGAKVQPSGVILLSGLMIVAGIGMWKVRYWAVLGLQALLAITVVIAGLSILFANNWAAVALCLGFGLPGGFLFWKLVGAMARIQMPARPQPRPPSR
jgi:hypothetical protein